MKKRVLALMLLCVLFVMCFALASCGDGEAHVHTFKDTWSKDSSGHWYDATCECTDAPKNVLGHVDANNDGACDVCTYTDHTHEYAESWTADCTNHWKAASCGHIVVGIEIAPHADNTQDGVCDTCGYVIQNLHNHYYSDEWSSDAENHWHAALCEHGVEVADLAAHTLNDAGYCTVCDAKVKEIDKANILEVLKAAIANNNKVVTGTVIAGEMVYGSGSTLENGKTNKVFFVLGNKDSYVEWGSYDMTGAFIGIDEYWTETLENGDLFAVQIPYYDGASRNDSLKMFPVDGDPAKLNGYNYLPGNLLSAYDNNQTLAQALANLYDILVLNKNVINAQSGYNEETGVYSFSYSFFTVNKTDGKTESGEKITSYYVEYFDVVAEFTIDDNFVVNNATIKVDSYRNLEEVDEDLSYDPETNTVTFLPAKNATTYTYTVAQTSGERTYTTIYPKASLIPQGFELYSGTPIKDPNTLSVIGFDNKVLLGDTIKITEKKYTYLALGDPYPITSSFAFLNTDDISVTWVNNDPDSTGKLATMDPTFSWSGQYIAFFPKDNGSYTMTIKIGDVTKVVTIVIGEEELVPPADTADTKYVVVTDTNAWDDEYTFTAPEAGTYTFTIPANLGFFVSDAIAPVTDPFAPGYVAQAVNYEVELAQGQALTFNVGAQSKGIFAIGVAFVAGEVGGGDEDGGFDYTTTIVEGNNTLYFSQAEITADSAQRPLVITVAGDYQFNAGNLFVNDVTDALGNTYSKNDDYTITLVPGEYYVNFAMLSMFGVPADTAQELNLVNKSAEQEGGDEGGDTPTTETLNATYYAYMEGQTILTVEFSDDGTVVFSYLHPKNPSTLTANYTIADDVVTLTDTETGDALPQMAAYVTLTDGVPTTAGYNGWDYELYAESDTPSTEAPENVELSKGDNTVPVTGDANTMTNATITAEGTGVYYITAGTNAVVVADYMTYLSGETAMVIVENEGDILTIQVNSEDNTEGAVNVSVSFVAKAADEPAKDALEGIYKSGDYTVELTRQYGTGIYLVTVTNADYSVCLQFTYTLTDNGDNSYTLSNLVNVPNEWTDLGTDKIDEIVANGITFSIDPQKEAINGTYITIGEYNVGVVKENGEYFLTISLGWDTTLYFTYTVTDNGNGTLTLDQAYVENANEAIGEGVDKATTVANMEALVITINYDEEKEALNYYEYTGIDGYTVMFLKSEGEYYAYAFDADYTVQLYFTYTITDGVNGARVITLTYASRSDYESGFDEELIATIEAHNIVLGGLEGEGTYESPYVIEEAGDYVSPYAGGYDMPYFQFTAPVDGYATITSTYANLNVQYGTNADVPNNNSTQDGTFANTITVYLKADQTIYFTVADNTFPADAVDVPFTATFEPFTSEDPSFLAGEWNGAQTNVGGSIPYTFNFNADGTGTGSYVQMGSSTAFTINYVVVNGSTVLVNFTTSGWWSEEKNMTFTYDEENGTLTGDAELIKAKKLEAGSIQINATNDKYVFYATEEIMLNLKVGASVMAGNVTVTYYVNGTEVKALTFNENADVTLAIGDQLLVVITADTYSSLTVARVYPEGSEQNPIVIEALPYDMTHTGDNGETYYTYTATEDITLTITCPEGCLVSGTGVSKDDNGNYVVALTAGQTLTLNPWANTADTTSESTYTYTITGETPEVEEGGDGTTDSGVAGTYVSATADNGKTMTVVIDTDADTIAFTRSGSTTTYTYTYSTTVANVANGSAISTVDGSYSAITSIAFDANGLVTSVVWNGASYTDYTKQ